MDFEDCFHVKTFKDCSLIEASNVFKAYARAFGWTFLSYKTLEIIVKAVLAIAALWLCVSCTMSMSISKNNMNSTQSTEQSQATSVDSTNVDVDYK